MMEKAQRFAPGAGKKHHSKADADYSAAVRAGNSERDTADASDALIVVADDATPSEGA
jgi:hypothetical protein